MQSQTFRISRFVQVVKMIHICCSGLVTPSGVTSVPIGVETPDMIELRKQRIEDAIDQGGDTPALYTILPEKKAAVGGAMMGSSHVYDISAVVSDYSSVCLSALEGLHGALMG